MTIDTDIYPWQRDHWAQLVDLVAAGRLPHGLLLAGPGEIGKRRFAMTFAQLLLCAGPVAGLPCGRCKSCQLFAAGSHPDFTLVEPVEEGKVIKVDQIRQLSEFATRTASLGERRTVVIAPAEAMNANAANAFLKTLEEPGRGITLILVVHQPGLILPTIRSRCRIVGFPLPPREAISDWLGGRDGDVAQAMALSGGRPLRALSLLDTELGDQLQLFNDTLGALEAGRVPVLDAAKVLQGLPRDYAGEWFQYLVYDRIKTLPQAVAEIQQLMFRFLDRLNGVRQRLHSSANPNPQLVWEELLMDWKSVLDLHHNKTRSGGQDHR